MTRSFLQKITKYIARATIARYRPKLVIVTGSVGKTSTKEAIRAVLGTRFRVRASILNQNNELGVPLTILGARNAGRSVSGWANVIFRGIWGLIWKLKSYPQILVLEYGIDKPKDMDYLLSIARPDVAVVTALGTIPVHVEFFSSPKALAKEKSKLISALSKDGVAVLNFDDAVVAEMHEVTRAKVITFGFGDGADVRGDDWVLLEEESSSGFPEMLGMTFKVHSERSFIPVRLRNVFGKPQAYSALAAIAVGEALGLHLVEMAQALESIVPVPGRMRILPGIKNTLLIDDTYNASPLSVHSALDFLHEVRAPRKIAVLGDMLEIGKYAEEAHRSIGDLAEKIADIIFAVGPRARFLYQEALENGFPKDRLYAFDDSGEAGVSLQNILQEGDVVLIKGSRAMHMERIVREVMANPQDAPDLLVK